MKILIDATAVPRNPAGAGIYTQGLIRALAKMSEEVQAFVRSDSTGWDPSAGFQGVGLQEVGVQSRLGRLGYQEFLLARRANRIGSDIFHGPHYELPRGLSMPAVVTFHDPTFWTHPHLHEPAKRLWFKGAWQRAARRAARVIVPSAYSAAFAAEYADPHAIDVIGHGPSIACSPIATLEDETLRANVGIDGPYILWVGTIEPRKSVHTLVDAFSKLVAGGLKHQLCLAGARGWKTSAFDESLARAGDARDQIVLTSYVNETTKAALLRGADVFAYPSIAEGFGIPVLEALASKTPVITTERSAMQDLALDCALYVAVGDADALAQSIHRLIEDREFANDMADRGLARASEFSWENSARAHLKTYAKAAQ